MALKITNFINMEGIKEDFHSKNFRYVIYLSTLIPPPPKWVACSHAPLPISELYTNNNTVSMLNGESTHILIPSNNN